MKPSQFHTIQHDNPVWPIISCILCLFLIMAIGCNHAMAQLPCCKIPDKVHKVVVHKGHRRVKKSL